MTTSKRAFFKIQKAAGVTAGTLGILGKASQWIALLLIATLPSVSNAIQQDAEYLMREKQFGEQWVTEDTQVQQAPGAHYRLHRAAQQALSGWCGQVARGKGRVLKQKPLLS